MALANRLEIAPSHTSLIRASEATNWHLGDIIAMSFFLALEIKLFHSTLEPENAENKENICIVK
ncbi:MAG TPA: hypothetical protein VJS91_06875 [Nitrososphaeraceae archaeon]|nr:hypothetical protein [Nitrososphaeraceae archaeon]